MAKVTRADAAAIRVRIGDRPLTAQDAMMQIAKNPERVAQMLVAGDATVSASKPVIDWLQTIFGARNVGDDGAIAPDLDGVEETLVVIAVIGTVGGFAVGYLKGRDDGEAAEPG